MACLTLLAVQGPGKPKTKNTGSKTKTKTSASGKGAAKAPPKGTTPPPADDSNISKEATAFNKVCGDAQAIEVKTRADLVLADGVYADLSKVGNSFPANATGLANILLIEAALAKVDNGNLLADLNTDQKNLTTDQTSLPKAYLAFKNSKTCAQDKSTSKSLKSNFDGYKDLLLGVGQIITSSADKQTKIRNASAAKVDTFLAALNASLSSLTADNATFQPDAVLVKHPDHFADLLTALSLRVSLTPHLKLIKQYVSSGSPATGMPDPDAALQASIAGLIPKIPGWRSRLTIAADQHESSSESVLSSILADPLANHVNGLATAAEEEDFVSSLKSTIATGSGIVDLLSNSDCPLTISKCLTLKDRAPEIAGWSRLRDSAAKMGVINTQLQAAHNLNLNSWVSGEIRLFYFDDVPRLIQFLNPAGAQKGGDSSLRNTADQNHATLVSAAQDVANLQEEVNNDKAALADAQQLLNQAQTKLDKTQNRKQSLTNGQRVSITELQQKNDSAQSRLEKAKSDEAITANDLTTAQQMVTADATDKSKALALQRAQAADDAAKRRLGQAQSDADYAQSRLTEATTNASADLTDAQAQVDDLTTKVNAAQTKVDADAKQESSGNSDLRKAMSAAYVAAVADNLAFARARDNSPFWVAVPSSLDGTEGDPARRVMLYGSPDSRTVFIRGSLDDVNQVKRMIADLDRPEAQAELNLYSLELDSGTDAKSLEFARDAQRIVQIHLALEQLEADGAQRCLRSAVGAVLAQETSQGSEDLAWQSPLLKTRMGVFLKALPALGFKAKEFNDLDSNTVLSVLPEKRTPNSIAEALVDLAICEPNDRRKIMEKFAILYREQLPLLIDSSPALRPGSKYDSETISKVLTRLVSDEKSRIAGEPMQVAKGNSSGIVPPFPNLLAVVGAEGEGPDMETFKSEVLAQLKLRMRDKISEDLHRKWPLLVKLATDAADAGDRAIFAANGSTELEDFTSRTQSFENGLTHYKSESDILMKIYGASPDALDNLFLFVGTNFRPMFIGKPAGESRHLVIGQFKSQFESIHDSYVGPDLGTPPGWYEESHASLGQVDETLKRLMHAVDRDMKQNFLNPMIDRLGVDLQSSRLQVGIFEKTMILASNRLVARVDPQANAELSGGTNQNPLADLAPFLQVFGSAVKGGVPGTGQGAAGVLSSALFPQSTAASSFAGTAQGGVRGILNLANQTPSNGGGPAVYGITSGNSFTVTPIFDPTGQALRFRLDYVLQTQTREPDGAVNPLLSRIERHSLNTEVQLSNFDVTQVSSFNVNSQIGLPSRKTGGLPILKDLFPFSEIPLVGWFTKRKVQAAMIQQSLILTQTSMYPTMLDIMNLLTGD